MHIRRLQHVPRVMHMTCFIRASGCVHNAGCLRNIVYYIIYSCEDARSARRSGFCPYMKRCQVYAPAIRARPHCTEIYTFAIHTHTEWKLAKLNIFWTKNVVHNNVAHGVVVLYCVRSP